MSSKGRNILIVEDDPTVREMSSALLKKNGYETTTAADGGKAIALLDKEAFDLIITDILMPEHDGLELIRLAKAKNADQKIIALSGGGLVDKKFCLELATVFGADRIFNKPVDQDQLLEAIDALTLVS